MPHHAAQDQRPAELEAEIATTLDPDMEIESSDRGVRLQEEAIDPSRHTQDVGQVNQRALINANRRPANASPSEPPSTSAAAASVFRVESDSTWALQKRDLQETTR